MRTTPRIIVPHGTASKLARMHGITPQHASNCLRFRVNSEQAEIIRKDAILLFKGKEVNVPI